MYKVLNVSIHCTSKHTPTPYYNKLLLYLYFHSKGIMIIVLE